MMRKTFIILAIFASLFIAAYANPNSPPSSESMSKMRSKMSEMNQKAKSHIQQMSSQAKQRINQHTGKVQGEMGKAFENMKAKSNPKPTQ